MTKVTKDQLELCQEQGISPNPPDPLSKLGISRTFSSHDFPINGLRHPPEEGTNGWFIWSGEVLSSDPDFFVPLHVMHIEDYCPDISKYLALPPGWRFLFALDSDDVWFDESLLEI